MTIQSSIQELKLFDLMQVLHMSKKNGRLMVTDGPEGKRAEIVFKKGDVGFAVIHDRVPKTVETLLVDWGVVDNASLARIEKSRRRYSTAMRAGRFVPSPFQNRRSKAGGASPIM